VQLHAPPAFAKNELAVAAAARLHYRLFAREIDGINPSQTLGRPPSGQTSVGGQQACVMRGQNADAVGQCTAVGMGSTVVR